MAESDSADTRPEPERVDGEGSQPRQQATTNMAPQPPPKGHPQQPLPPPLASVKHAQRQSQPVYYPQPVPAGAPVPVAPGYYTYEPQVVSGGPAFPTISADPPFNEKWHRAKILLSTASVICCIVFFVVGLVAGSRLSGSSYGWGFAFFAQFGIGGAGVSLEFNPDHMLNVWSYTMLMNIGPACSYLDGVRVSAYLLHCATQVNSSWCPCRLPPDHLAHHSHCLRHWCHLCRLRMGLWILCQLLR